MFRNHRPVWQEINLDNLAYNMKNIRDNVSCKEIFGVVKANAYGHGALEVAPVLLENGATRLSVACLSEAVELRKGGIICPINVLGVTPPTLFKEMIEYDIEPAVFSYDYALELSQLAQVKNKNVRIHIAVDTGMGRIGFRTTDESIKETLKISNLPNIMIEGVFSHFSSADENDKEYTHFQYEQYLHFIDKLEKMGVRISIRHIANSAAIIELPNTHLDGVRPGIILYGYYPSEEVTKDIIDLKPVATLKANIVHLKTVGSGEFIGYGRNFKTKRKSVIATLPLGYADGYPRTLTGKAKVIVNGQLAPVVGNICMDQCMVDVTDINDIKLGDEVIVMGSDKDLNCDGIYIAAEANSIVNEIISRISVRVPRVFVKNGQVIKVKNYI